MWLQKRMRERTGGGRAREWGRGQGQSVGGLKGSVETKSTLRKGEKRPQKIKWLLYGVKLRQ